MRLRDTWESGHHAVIADRCDAIALAIRQGDDETAEREYNSLNKLIGNRELHWEGLARKVESIEVAFRPVATRLQRDRRLKADRAAEAERIRQRVQRERELAAKREDEQRQAASRARIQKAKNTYYRDGTGSLISQWEVEQGLERIEENIYRMQDGPEKSYYQGMLRAARDEWYRMLSEGPVEQ